MKTKVVAKSITAQNTWTDPINPSGGTPRSAVFPLSVSVAGIAGGSKATLQRSFDGGAVWNDVTVYTDNAEEVAHEIEADVLYRIGVKTAEFGSGTVLVRLARA